MNLHLNYLRESKIFKEEKDEIENNDSNYKDKVPIKILKLLKTDINFILVYVPRGYVNIKSNNSNEVKVLKEEFEKLKRELSNSINKINDLKTQITKLTEENKIFQNKVTNLQTQVNILTEENKQLKLKIGEH